MSKMDKSTEKYLKKLIIESVDSDVDEMASYRGAEEPQRRKTLGKEINPCTPIWSPTNPTPFKAKGIPDAYLLNLTKQPGDYVLVLYAGKDAVSDEAKQKYKQDNSSWIDEVIGDYNVNENNIKILSKSCPADCPRNVELGTPWTGPTKSLSAATFNNRILKDILFKEIYGSGFADVLNKVSIPSIVVRDRKNLDNHGGVFENDRIVFRTHNNNSYETAFDFLNAILDRYEGQEPDYIKTYHMPRGYNTKYRRWEAERKMSKIHQGKTPVRKDDVRQFEEKNLDVTIRMDMEILGEKMDNSFSWNVRLKVNLGKKLTEDPRMRGGFENLKLIQSTTTAQLEPNKVFDENNPIMKDINVVSALIEAIHDLKEQVSQITLEELLPHANIDVSQAIEEPTTGGEELNEMKERLVKRILKQIK